MEGQKALSKAERRWLVREIEGGRMSMAEAAQLVGSSSKNPRKILYPWREQFAPDIPLTLPVKREKKRKS